MMMTSMEGASKGAECRNFQLSAIEGLGESGSKASQELTVLHDLFGSTNNNLRDSRFLWKAGSGAKCSWLGVFRCVDEGRWLISMLRRCEVLLKLSISQES